MPPKDLSLRQDTVKAETDGPGGTWGTSSILRVRDAGEVYLDHGALDAHPMPAVALNARRSELHPFEFKHEDVRLSRGCCQLLFVVPRAVLSCPAVRS